MYGLLIDTSSPIALLGLLDGSNLLKMELLDGAKQLSSSFFPALEQFCDIKDISYIAVGIGPGSYMGVRTGATIAKTLAFARSLPLIEFPSLLAFLPPELEGPFAFLGDAKMGQYFLIRGRVEQGGIQDLAPATLIKKDDPLPENELLIGGEDALPTPHLSFVASYVYNRHIQKNTTTPNSLVLSYLRE